MSGSKKPTTQTVSTLSRGQKAVSNLLQQTLEQGLRAGGAVPFTGQAVADITQGELDALSRVNALTGPDAPLVPETKQALIQALSGQPSTVINPETTQRFFQEAVAEPATRRFREEEVPFLEERFIGPGTFFGSPRTEAVRKATRDFEEGLLAERANLAFADEQARRSLAESARARAIQGIGQSTAARALATEQNLQNLQAQALPRILDQAQLDFDYREFLRTQPEASPFIAQALQFLGIPQVAVVSQPGQQGALGPILGGGLSAAGSIASSALLASALGSSETFKTDITENNLDTIEMIKGIEVVNFKYKPEIVDDKKTHIGVITEQIPEVLVTEDGKHLDVVDMLGMLIDVNKKLIKRIETLEEVT